METFTWEAPLGASLLLCGGKQLPFSSSSPALKKKEKMPLAETEIHADMVAIEATSFYLDLTVNWASCFMWSNDFNAAVRSHWLREGTQESKAVQPHSPCKAMVQNA